MAAGLQLAARAGIVFLNGIVKSCDPQNLPHRSCAHPASPHASPRRPYVLCTGSDFCVPSAFLPPRLPSSHVANPYPGAKFERGGQRSIGGHGWPIWSTRSKLDRLGFKARAGTQGAGARGAGYDALRLPNVGEELLALRLLLRLLLLRLLLLPLMLLLS